jgi:hypothetical protein
MIHYELPFFTSPNKLSALMGVKVRRKKTVSILSTGNSLSSGNSRSSRPNLNFEYKFHLNSTEIKKI